MADRTEIGRLAVSHGEDEVGADEDVHLAELDLLGVVEVARRAQDDEQRVAVALELRTLVGDDRVLDGELVQLECLGQCRDLVLLGSVETDPRHAFGLFAQRSERVGERRR